MPAPMAATKLAAGVIFNSGILYGALDYFWQTVHILKDYLTKVLFGAEIDKLSRFGVEKRTFYGPEVR